MSLSARPPTLQQLLHVTGDSVGEVLDLYRTQNVVTSNGPRPRIIDDVKQLFTTIQTYEQQVLRIDCATLGAAITPLPDTQGLLRDCTFMGQRLQNRVKQGALTDSTETRMQLHELSEAVSQLIIANNEGSHLSHNMPHAPDPPSPLRRDAITTLSDIPGSDCENHTTSSHLHASLEVLIRENEALKEQLAMTEANDQSKLHHIKRLHAAIKCLNARHPMRHKLNTWEELTEELPHLLEQLDATNDLKDFENNQYEATMKQTPKSDPPSRKARQSSNIRSEPTSPRERSERKEIVSLRPPSPTESTVSSLAGNPTMKDIGSSSQHRKTRRPKNERRKGAGVERDKGGLWNN